MAVFQQWIDAAWRNGEDAIASGEAVILGQTYELSPPLCPDEQSEASRPSSPTVSTEESTKDRPGSPPQLSPPPKSTNAAVAAPEPWPEALTDDVATRFWLTYRAEFPPIARNKRSIMNLVNGLVRRRSLGLHELGSDTGWGCMIRTGQTLLANALLLLRKGREWRRNGTAIDSDEEEILSLFRDSPDAPFSIHRIVAHGFATFQKDVDEWFAPSEVASAIKFLSEHTGSDFFEQNEVSDEDAYRSGQGDGQQQPEDNTSTNTNRKTPPAVVSPSVAESLLRDMRVYNGGNDVYENIVFDVARRGAPDGAFMPTLILLRLRLGGGDTVNPVYYDAIRSFLRSPHSVGIAGGRPRSSYYFYGYHGDRLLYLNPHTEKRALQFDEETGTFGVERHAEVHTRKIDALRLAAMDPTMLVGFLVRSEHDYYEWKTYMQTNCGSTISISSLDLRDDSSDLAVENFESDDDFVTVSLPGRRPSQYGDLLTDDASATNSSLAAVEEGASILSTTEEDRLYADAVSDSEPVVVSRRSSIDGSGSTAVQSAAHSNPHSDNTSEVSDRMSSSPSPPALADQSVDDGVMVATPSDVESMTGHDR